MRLGYKHVKWFPTIPIAKLGIYVAGRKELASLQKVFTVADYMWGCWHFTFANCISCSLENTLCACVLCSDPELNMCNRMSFDRLKEKLPCPVFTVLPTLSRTTSGTKLWCSTLCERVCEWEIQQLASSSHPSKKGPGQTYQIFERVLSCVN